MSPFPVPLFRFRNEPEASATDTPSVADASGSFTTPWPMHEAGYFFLRPARSVFAACDSFFSGVRGFLSALPASLSCFFVGFFAIATSFHHPA